MNITEREIKLQNKIRDKLKDKPIILRLFYGYLREQGKSLSTIDVYLNNILHFYNSFYNKNQISRFYKNVSTSNIQNYFSLLRKNGSGDDILQARWSSLNTFFTWLSETKRIEINPMLEVERPKNHKEQQITCLTKSEIGRLLDAIDRESSTIVRLRDKTVISLILSTALRVGTLVNIDVADVDKL